MLSFLVDSTTGLLLYKYQEIFSSCLINLKIKRGSGDLMFYITFKSMYSRLYVRLRENITITLMHDALILIIKHNIILLSVLVNARKTNSI